MINTIILLGLILSCYALQVVRPGRPGGFVMRAPGALHHARFMASCLYLLKMALLSDVLPRGLVTAAMRTKIDRMALYIALFHGPWFLQSRVPVVAPRLDMQLWGHMCVFEVSNIVLLDSLVI